MVVVVLSECKQRIFCILSICFIKALVPNITEIVTVPMLHKIYSSLPLFVLPGSDIALPTEYTLHTTLVQVASDTSVVCGGGEDVEEPDTSK